MAAVHRDDVRNTNEYYQTNVLGAENIATVCNENGIRKLYLQFSVAYGFAEPGTDEIGKINPLMNTELQNIKQKKYFVHGRKMAIIL